MKRLLLFAAVAAGLAMPQTAAAFHHGGVPADECAPEEAGTPGSNPTARQALMDAGLSLPLAPVNTPGDAHTPSTCPSPDE
jgi:hypothetical protein